MGDKGGVAVRKGLVAKTCGAVTIGLFIWISFAASAQAVPTHVLANTFGSFAGPMGVAIDGSSNPADPAVGDVYVVDTGSHSVVRFDVTGDPDAFSASGSNIIDNAITGTPTSPFIRPQFVAVDPANGDFYVSDSATGAVYKFDPAGNLLTTIDATSGVPVGNSGSFSPFGVVVNPSSAKGDVYVENRGYYNGDGFTQGDQIAEFAAAGTLIDGGGIFAIGPIFGEPPLDNFAIDTSGDYYVVLQGDKVNEYDPKGVQIGGLDAHAPTAVAIDPSSGDIYVAENSPQRIIREFNSAGEPIDSFGLNNFGSSYGLSVDASHDVYVTDNSGTTVSVFRPATPPAVATNAADDVTAVSARLNGFVEPAGNGEITSCHFEYGIDKSYSLGSVPCKQALPLSGATRVSANVSGLTPEAPYHFRLVGANASVNSVNPGADETFTTSPISTPEVGTGNATDITQVGATANGIVDPAGGPPILNCYVEWGLTAGYGNATLGCDQNAGLPFSTPTEVTATFLPLTPATTYHYRIVAENEDNIDEGAAGQDESFTTLPEPPTLSNLSVLEVRSDLATLHAQINPNMGDTTYHFQYVDDEKFQTSGFAEATSIPIPDGDAGSGSGSVAVSRQTGMLAGGAEYHFRLVATNSGGTSITERTFRTFSTGSETDTCPNAHVRQQTSAAQLPDCRAYELVSATNTGGYNVESNLVAGETPFGGFPQASGASGASRLLYAIHNGGVPGVGDPTNKGNDPYVATRGEKSWSTSYVGIPASGTPSTLPFASTLEEADPSLDTFAFGGEDICAPCFSDKSSGTPIHLPNGSLVQGMVGSIQQLSAVPAGHIGKHFSADGTHFVFGSTSQFEPNGNSNGDVSIYDRNLTTGVTRVVSTTPGEATMTGPGIAELDISSNGSRIVIGQLVGTDAKENHYYHLYMNIGDSGKTIDLTPGAADGVLYDGMTSDGSKVFFTTKDQLAGGADTDDSADIYQAEVAAGGTMTLTRISTGTEGTGNTDSCNPTENWNTVLNGPSCDVVAIGGGGGVASASGTIYLFSPELLDGSSKGTLNEPNLYVVRPGSTPHYVATLETVATAPPPEETIHSFLHSFGELTAPKGIAANQTSNDVYVTDPGNFRIDRFNLAGKLISVFGKGVDKTTGGDVCTVSSHDICQPGTQGTAPGEFSEPHYIAVDNSSDPSAGDVYVGDDGNDAISKFDAAGNLLSTWGIGGQLDGSTGGGAFGGSFCGMAIGQGGELFVVNNAFGLFRYAQDGSFIVAHGFGPSVTKDGLAVNESGDIFFVSPNGQIVEVSSTGSTIAGGFAEGPATGVAIDPSGGLYVSYADHVVHYDASGNFLEKSIGAGHISGGAGVALDGRGNVYVANNGSGDVAEFGAPSAGENPAVFDSVNEAGIRRTEVFQVNAGGDAVVGTGLALKAEYHNGGHSEVYRYDPAAETLDCVSCNPTNGDAAGNATLASNGFSLTDDGRVFFNSTDSLDARDGDNKEDVYEWEPDTTGGCKTAGGCVGLISTGTSRFDARLLGVSADGTDAFFFTRDILVPQDENGTLTKIYDARELGGFPFIPDPVPCKASDECHGPSSQAAPPPNIGTFKGSGGNVLAGKCPKGFVKKHSKCVRKRHNRRPHHRHEHRHG